MSYLWKDIKDGRRKKMKVPNNISNLKDLSEWTIKHQPKKLEISKDSKLRAIKEFINGSYKFTWKDYRGIPIEYGK